MGARIVIRWGALLLICGGLLQIPATLGSVLMGTAWVGFGRAMLALLSIDPTSKT